MKIYVDEVLKNIKYTKGSFSKVLTRTGISNHFELTLDDLLKLQALPVINGHSHSLRLYLDELLNNVDYKCND